MAKQTLTQKQKSIWDDQILGTKGAGLPSRKSRNLVDILQRELGLLPAFGRYGDVVEVFDFKDFRDNDRTVGKPDGFAHFFYDPEECYKSTGSRRDNWLAWSNLVLSYGRKSHELAPLMKPPEGVDVGWNPTRYRFLSLELVVFYLAIQMDTWADAGRILMVKDFLKAQGIDVYLPPVQEDLNVTALLDSIEDTKTFSVVPERRVEVKTSLPKAGRNLVDYNPVIAVAATANGVQVTRKDGVVGTVSDFRKRSEEAAKTPYTQPEVKDEVNTLLNDLFPLLNDLFPTDGTGTPTSLTHGSPVKQPSDLSEDEIADQISKLQAALEEKQKVRRIQSMKDNAEKGVIVAGEMFEDKGQYMAIHMNYPDGTSAIYYHQDVLTDLAVQGLGTAPLHQFGWPLG